VINDPTRADPPPLTQEQFQALTNDRFERGSQRMRALEVALEANTEMTRKGLQATTEVVEVFADLKGGFKTLQMLGRLAKPLGAVAALIAACLAALATLKGAGWWPK
jgi:hypothetical protein